MRFISTLVVLLYSTASFSQIYDLIRDTEYKVKRINTVQLCGMRGELVNSVDLYAIQQKALKKDTVPVKIFIRCGGTFSSNCEPLIVIDGIPLLENKLFSAIDTSEIERIDILKNSVSTAIYGADGVNGVILVTTKKAGLRKFIINDFLDGNPIPGATLSFMHSDRKDTIILIANDSGIVVTDRLKGFKNYDLSVSAIGYKQSKQTISNSYVTKNQKVLMERDVKQCEEVILSQCIHCRRIGCGGCMVRRKITYTDSSFRSFPGMQIGKVFPNPVSKGRAITIETEIILDGPIDLRLISLDGKLLLLQHQQSIKGLNRFVLNTDQRWADGIYIVQLYANGQLLASDKVVIQ